MLEQRVDVGAAEDERRQQALREQGVHRLAVLVLADAGTTPDGLDGDLQLGLGRRRDAEPPVSPMLTSWVTVKPRTSR